MNMQFGKAKFKLHFTSLFSFIHYSSFDTMSSFPKLRLGAFAADILIDDIGCNHKC